MVQYFGADNGLFISDLFIFQLSLILLDILSNDMLSHLPEGDYICMGASDALLFLSN